MNLRLKKDIVIPAGTIFDDNVAIKTARMPNSHVEHILGFGANATGHLVVGHEIGDTEFDEWFECETPYRNPDGSPYFAGESGIAGTSRGKL